MPLSWPSSSTCLHVCVYSDLQYPSPSSARPSSAQASLHTASSRSCVTRARENYVEPRPGNHQDCPTAPTGWVTDSGKHSPSSATAACGPVQPLRRPFLRASQPVAQNPSCQPRSGRGTRTCSLSSLGVPGGQQEVSKHRIVGIDAPRCLSHVLLPPPRPFRLRTVGTSAPRESVVASEVLYLLKHSCTYASIMLDSSHWSRFLDIPRLPW